MTCPYKREDPMSGSSRKEGAMPRLRHTIEQILAKLRETEIALARASQSNRLFASSARWAGEKRFKKTILRRTKPLFTNQMIKG
jgi:hypothetical protein